MKVDYKVNFQLTILMLKFDKSQVTDILRMVTDSTITTRNLAKYQLKTANQRTAMNLNLHQSPQQRTPSITVTEMAMVTAGRTRCLKRTVVKMVTWETSLQLKKRQRERLCPLQLQHCLLLLPKSQREVSNIEALRIALSCQ